MLNNFSWKKLFRFPGPADLGMSRTNNSMGMRDFASPGQKTWEDYEDYLRLTYPVRFFLAYSVRDFVRHKLWLKLTKPLKDALYWIKCHTLPSYRFHMIDIRDKNYRYGYQDTDHRMLLAWMSLLTYYIEVEEAYCPELDHVYEESWDNGREIMKRQRSNYLEAKIVYDWWHWERKAEERTKADLQHIWWELRKVNRDSKEAQAAFEAMNIFDEHVALLEEEMLIRLVKVRKSLWT